MMAKLIVVGNAEPAEDYSELIDDSDIVVRFNYTPFFETGRTGRQTTYLCLFGLPYPRAGEIPRLNTHIVKDCQTIWVEDDTFFEPLVRGYDVPRDKILLTYMKAFSDAYAVEGAYRITAPSSGFQVLRYLINTDEFTDYRTYICGFDWFGAERHLREGHKHLWEMEEKQVNHYIKIGLLESLEGL